ncbi:hypothetical protein HKK80_12095 [Halonotius sp. F2-221B]|jgi:hypothetical protein|uniref:hypothetical protein n=1 Tax=Halonotius TaxID=869896 RepID=UPI001402856E|nr:hypothetical protein [Halonotius aquaticus]
MSDPLRTDSFTSKADFETALGTLLDAAEKNDIDPKGSWVFSTDSKIGHNYEVIVYELE